nr:immunoglobulin heavy chain junction region [Macaca mulatta]
CVRDQSNYDFW